MNKEKPAHKTLSKRAKVMLIIAAMLPAILVVGTLSIIWGTIPGELKTIRNINSISDNLSITQSKEKLAKLAENNRILNIMAIDKDGKILYGIKDWSITSDQSGTVKHDEKTNLLKYEGSFIAYFNSTSAFGALLNIDESEWEESEENNYDSSVKSNLYQTVVLGEKGTENKVLIICSQDNHTSFIAAAITIITLWIGFVAYTCIAVGIAVADNAKKKELNHKLWGIVGLIPVAGVISYNIYLLAKQNKNLFAQKKEE